MNIEALIVLARSKKADKTSVAAFIARVEKREKIFAENRRLQAPTEQFLARSYTL
jgi:hypothetical protein